MTEREMFEEKFPVPSETVWSDHLSAYVQKNRRVLSAYDDLWQVWQAARATPALPYQPDEIPRLVECLKKANENAEHFERQYYLLCDKVEELESRAPALPQGKPEPVAMFCRAEHSGDLGLQWNPDFDPYEGALLYSEPPKPQALPQGVEAWAASGKDYDRNIHSNPDAKAWADFFMETFPNCGADHGTILGWFANAMMAMHDHLLSGMAIVPVDAMPAALPMEPFQTIDMGSKNYKAGWNSCRLAMLAAAKEKQS